MNAVVILRRAAGTLAAADPHAFGLLVQAMRLAAAHLERDDELNAGAIMQRAVLKLDEVVEEPDRDEAQAIVTAVARLVLAGAHPEVACRVVSGNRALPPGKVEAIWEARGAQAALRLAREGR